MTQVSVQYAPEPSIGNRPGRLWSLLDIMNTFDAKRVCKRVADFRYAKAACMAMNLPEHHPDQNSDGLARAVKHFQIALRGALEVVRPVAMQDAVGHMERLLKKSERPDAFTFESIIADSETVESSLLMELEKRRFLYVPPELASYIDQEQLFGSDVFDVFGKARDDVRDVGNCLAVGCSTAAVFHLMRVAEHGLRAVAKKLRVTLKHRGVNQPIEYGDWNDVIVGVRNKITSARQLPRGPRKDKALEFYSDVADQCEYMKDIWRNTIAHTRRPYNQSEAMGIKQRVQEFMTRLSKELASVK